MVNEVTTPFPRALVEFQDPADDAQVIRADLTWLTSHWSCIFGAGCPGIDAAAPHAGCCSFGAHFADRTDERRVKSWARRLTPDTWQHHPGGRMRDADWIETDPDGDRKTAVVAGACVFLNDPGFRGGAGCALHHLAQSAGESPVATKPDVCWQLPLRRDYDWRELADGRRELIITITEYTRAMWGPGGHDFPWYCSSDPRAHGAPSPVYRSHRAELVALIGAAAYEELLRHCEAHEAARAALRLTPVGDEGLAPHPADPS